jgi:hypothetical protein
MDGKMKDLDKPLLLTQLFRRTLDTNMEEEEPTMEMSQMEEKTSHANEEEGNGYNLNMFGGLWLSNKEVYDVNDHQKRDV